MDFLCKFITPLICKCKIAISHRLQFYRFLNICDYIQPVSGLFFVDMHSVSKLLVYDKREGMFPSSFLFFVYVYAVVPLSGVPKLLYTYVCKMK